MLSPSISSLCCVEIYWKQACSGCSDLFPPCCSPRLLWFPPPVYTATYNSALMFSTDPAATSSLHFPPLSFSWVPFFAQMSCKDIFYLLNPFFCPRLCLCPQFMPTCNHQAFAYRVAFSTSGFPVKTFFPRTTLNTYMPPMVSLMGPGQVF